MTFRRSIVTEILRKKDSSYFVEERWVSCATLVTFIVGETDEWNDEVNDEQEPDSSRLRCAEPVGQW